jgi:hypothetical protein
MSTNIYQEVFMAQNGVAANLIGEAKEATIDLADEAKQTTVEIVDRVKQTFTEQVQSRSQQFAERAQANEQDLKAVAEQLRGQGHEIMASVMDTEARMFARVGDYLRGTDGKRLMDDLTNAARKQPLVAAATGFTLGLAGARFVKASSTRTTPNTTQQ